MYHNYACSTCKVLWDSAFIMLTTTQNAQALLVVILIQRVSHYLWSAPKPFTRCFGCLSLTHARSLWYGTLKVPITVSLCPLSLLAIASDALVSRLRLIHTTACKAQLLYSVEQNDHVSILSYIMSCIKSHQ